MQDKSQLPFNWSIGCDTGNLLKYILSYCGCSVGVEFVSVEAGLVEFSITSSFSLSVFVEPFREQKKHVNRK